VTAVRATRASPNARLPLRRTGRRVWLAVHLWSAGAWLGLDLALGAVVLTGLSSDEDTTRATCFQVLEVLAVWPLPLAGLACLASGVVLGLGTSHGLLRYWWVTVKLAINLVLTTLVLVLLRPNMRHVAGQGRDLAAGRDVSVDVSSLVMPPSVTVVALTVAVWLSVWKPWGRIRRAPAG
jgi:hypothetical protein